MATWIFEPGHTGAEFRARHMMAQDHLHRSFCGALGQHDVQGRR